MATVALPSKLVEDTMELALPITYQLMGGTSEGSADQSSTLIDRSGEFTVNSDPTEYYIPSKAEIAAACQEIQARWSHAERMRRWRGDCCGPR